MNFFKPEDLDNGLICNAGPDSCIGQATKMANAKLDREGKVVYSLDASKWSGHWAEDKKNLTYELASHKALLINIKKIEPEHKHEWVCNCGSVKHD